ncbi:hypothetical protein UY286_08520 [Paenibacillus polymyxa]|uniref:hypothetical protein n=1 Tax=Paenibacillus polymyxa TaxID=1406 RepID=UPI002AB40FBD|nr:hypothetical protein [Paenibacillus polymyxa]MDY7990708.1 hypothetical protein [Paenibacillus polymyxa]MDY8117481.1 hypothetical protein [Paenibacillus polymyxa]
MDQKFKQTIFIFLFIIVLFITGCTVNGEQPVPKPTQTSGSEITNDPQDDIVYVDKETEFIASTLKHARYYLKSNNLNQKSQEDSASAVEMLGEYFDGEVRERFMEVAKYIRLGDKEQVRQLCDEIEEKYVTKYSWKRDS